MLPITASQTSEGATKLLSVYATHELITKALFCSVCLFVCLSCIVSLTQSKQLALLFCYNSIRLSSNLISHTFPSWQSWVILILTSLVIPHHTKTLKKRILKSSQSTLVLNLNVRLNQR